MYRPGCYEHYVIHVLRDDPAFVKELKRKGYGKILLDYSLEKAAEAAGAAVLKEDNSNSFTIITVHTI